MRITLSATPFVSDRWGVEIRWFHDRSSQDLSNSNEWSVLMTFGLCDGSKNFRHRFSGFLVKISFCTDTTGSIEWPRLVPRQRTSECLLIHIPHWGLCDQPLSSHQNFLLEVELRQCVFCKEPLSFWFASRLRNFGLLGSEYKYCASLILMPLSQDVPNLRPENCVRVHALLCPLDYLRAPPTIQEDLATGRPILDCHPSSYFGFWFSGGIRSSHLGLLSVTSLLG